MLKEEFLGRNSCNSRVINHSLKLLIVYSGTYKFGTYKTMHAVNCDSACPRERHAMSVILENVWFCNNSES